MSAQAITSGTISSKIDEKRINDAYKQKREKKELENLRKVAEKMGKKNESGITGEQEFLMKYYGIEDKDDIIRKDINFSNIDNKVIESYDKYLIQGLEETRYRLMLELYFDITPFEDGQKKINKMQDKFHKDISSIEDFLENFGDDAVIIQGLRNLQMTNRMAHHYETLLKKMFYREFPEINKLSNENKDDIFNRVKDLYKNAEEAKTGEEKLKELGFTTEKINDLKKDKAFKCCVDTSIWFFRQKGRYIENILSELKKDNRGINYGIKEEDYNKGGVYRQGDIKSLVFDVPGFGQFTAHKGKNAYADFKRYKDSYGVKKYNGEYLGDVIILNRADPELAKTAKFQKESQYIDVELEKKKFEQRRRIATQELREPIGKLKNIEQENNLEEIEEDVPDNTQIEQKEGEDKIQKENVQEIDIERKENIEKMEKLIAGSKNSAKAREIVKILEDVGIRPEEVLNKTVIQIGNPEAVKTIIEIATDPTTKFEVETLYKNPTLLGMGKKQADTIRPLIEKINELGIDSNIINENSNFLRVAKTDRLEPIYDVLKEYEIDLKNSNIATAFEGNAENIKANMNLVIENGLYDLAKQGVEKFFTTRNENFNMRINLLNSRKDPLVIERAHKRKINSKIFKKEEDLLKEFGVTKEQVLKELSKIQGQELIQDSEYYAEQTTNQIELTEKQQEISKNICAKLDNNQTVDGVVMQIGEYYYSVPKVKEQVDSIIYNYNIQTLENIDVSEILKIALLKNKNITQEEVEKTSEYLQNKLKEEPEIQAETEQLEQEEIIPDKLEIEEELEQEEIQEEVEEQEKNTPFEKLQEKTKEVQQKREFFEGAKSIIKNLELQKEKLKKEQRELEEKLDSKILEESNEEIIESIKEIRANLQKCINTRKKVKSMIKTYKQHKKEAKAELKKSEKERESLLDELEL